MYQQHFFQFTVHFIFNVNLPPLVHNFSIQILNLTSQINTQLSPDSLGAVIYHSVEKTELRRKLFDEFIYMKSHLPKSGVIQNRFNSINH